MEDIDMSRPGSELFPEAHQAPNHNSYQDVNQDQFVGDPLNTGVAQPDVAGQGQLSDKEMNFRALREETAKLQAEREYWKGQAEAYAKMPARQPEQPKPPAYDALDWDNSQDVRKAFDTLRQENQTLRHEMKDQMAAVQAKSQYQDWNNMVTRHVPELTNKNPIFAEMIQNASNPYEAAYLLAQLKAQATQTDPGVRPPEYGNGNGNGQRALMNAQKPTSLASVGGRSSLSSADYYATMSDEDFMKLAARNLANI